MKAEKTYRGYLSAVLSCRCPRCREGKLFRYPLSIGLKRSMDMHNQCPVCSQPTDIEVGFYYGTGYISYFLSLFISGFSFLLWFLLIGFSYKDFRFLTWIIINSVFLLGLQAWLMRFSRCFWLSCFVSYDPDWANTPPEEPERINKDQMTNW